MSQETRVVRARARALALMLAVSSGLLAACSGPAAPGAPGYAGEPTASGIALVVEGVGNESVRAWADGDLLIVTTHGSGSCPTVPQLESVNEGERTVSLSTSVPNSKGPCTADLAPHTFEFEAGRDLSGYAVQVAPR